MPGLEITNVIFIMYLMQEKYLAKKKKLYLAFADLENEFDSVPRKLTCWTEHCCNN